MSTRSPLYSILPCPVAFPHQQTWKGFEGYKVFLHYVDFTCLTKIQILIIYAHKAIFRTAILYTEVNHYLYSVYILVSYIGQHDNCCLISCCGVVSWYFCFVDIPSENISRLAEEKHGSILCLFGSRCIHGLLATCTVNRKGGGYGSSSRGG